MQEGLACFSLNVSICDIRPTPFMISSLHVTRVMMVIMMMPEERRQHIQHLLSSQRARQHIQHLLSSQRAAERSISVVDI